MPRTLPLATLALAFALSFGNLAVSAAAQGVVINELRTDQPGTDNDEYFELKGPAGTSLNGYTYFVIGDDSAGGSGVIEYVLNLSGQTIPADGLFLAGGGDDGDGVVFGVTADLNIDPNFENSDSVTHVLATGFTGAEGQDLDTNDDGVLDVMPWGEVIDAIGFEDDENDLAYGAALGFEDLGPVGAFPPAHAYRDGITEVWTLGEFDPALSQDTPGAPNPGTTANEPGAGAAAFALDVWPNPAAGQAAVRVTADATQALAVAAYDLLGRRVAVLFSGTALAGEPVTAVLDARLLPAGVYVVRVTGEAGTAAREVSVVR